jgi:membrane-bound metal-dependent hydrolase YbcI (DUF457 family)
MPSPLGHALAGLGVHLLSSGAVPVLRDPRRIALTVGAAVAPDLDLLFRYVDGRNHHQAETHSIGFAVLAGLAGFLLATWRHWARPVLTGAMAGAAWLSHVLLDLLGRDTHPPIGLMALWPFDHGFYKAPWLVFMDIGRSFDWVTVRHNTIAVAWELSVIVPIVLACLWLRRALVRRAWEEWRGARIR